MPNSVDEYVDEVVDEYVDEVEPIHETEYSVVGEEFIFARDLFNILSGYGHSVCDEFLKEFV